MTENYRLVHLDRSTVSRLTVDRNTIILPMNRSVIDRDGERGRAGSGAWICGRGDAARGGSKTKTKSCFGRCVTRGSVPPPSPSPFSLGRTQVIAGHTVTPYPSY